jgi:hypothetical protein
MEAGKRRPIANHDTCIKFSFDCDHPVMLSRQELDEIAEGPIAYADGTFVRLNQEPTIYYIDQRQKHSIPNMETFAKLSPDGGIDRAGKLGPLSFSQIPTGVPWPSAPVPIQLGHTCITNDGGPGFFPCPARPPSCSTSTPMSVGFSCNCDVSAVGGTCSWQGHVGQP